MILVFLFLTYFTMTLSRSINVSTNDPVLFHFMTEKNSFVYIHHIFFIQSALHGQPDFFVLAIVNSAAVDTGACMHPFEILV